MGIFFVYILKSAICLALFYLFYRLLLSKETFHRFNRVALLGLLVMSCVVPLIEVGTGAANVVNRQFFTWEEMLMMAEVSSMTEEVVPPTWSWREVLLLLYLVGIAFFFVRNLWSLARMFGLIDSCKKQRLDDDLWLFTHQKDITPFSWMKYIVLSEKDYAESGETILTHERAHIANRHSWDLLLADLCVFFQWFNPAAWLLKQELQNIHEYEADEWVINHGIDAKRYQLLLIKKAVGTRLYSMANNLNHSNLKKRITMMIKKKSNPWARMKYLYILPLATIAVAAFARPEISNEFDEISSAKVSDLASFMKADGEKSLETPSVTTPAPQDSVFLVVDEMPEFPGGMQAMMEYLAQHVKYPSIAQKNGVQGRVITQFTVSKDGSITDAKVLRSVDPYLDKEALRVVSAMPKWKPGKQGGKAVATRFTVPVVFRLNSDEPNEPIVVNAVGLKVDGDVSMGVVNDVKEHLRKGGQAKINYTIRNTSSDSKMAIRGKENPLIVVDGVEKGVGADKLQAVNPQDIASIEVLKPANAIAKFGDNAKEGAIIITTKNGEHKEAAENDTYDATLTYSHAKPDIILPNEETSPLIIIDGEEKGNDKSIINQLNAHDIESISVLKDKSAVEQYGVKAKDGAILITTKQASK